MARRCELTGKRYMAGNNVSHAHNKSRRRFNPNVQDTAVYSDVLGRSVRLKVAVSTLRSIERRGGLDTFLADAAEVDLSLPARRLKKLIGDKRAVQAAERAAAE